MKWNVILTSKVAHTAVAGFSKQLISMAKVHKRQMLSILQIGDTF